MYIYICIYIYIERDLAGQFGDVWGAYDDVANSSQISLAYRGLSPVSLHILLKLTKLNHHDRAIFGVKSSRTIGSLSHWQREHPARFWAFKPGDYGHWSSNQFVQRLLVKLDKPERSMGEIRIPIANWIPPRMELLDLPWYATSSKLQSPLFRYAKDTVNFLEGAILKRCHFILEGIIAATSLLLFQLECVHSTRFFRCCHWLFSCIGFWEIIIQNIKLSCFVFTLW